MAFPTTGILDNFNRGNETPVIGWTGIGATDIQVLSNEITGTDNDVNNMAYWDDTTFGPDSEAYATATGSVVYSVGVVARWDSATFDGYLAWSEANELQLYRIDSGVATELDVAAFTIATGDKIGIQCIGSAIKLWIKDGAAAWSEEISETDATYGNAGYIATMIFDNETGDRASDDLSGGTYVPPVVGNAGIMTTNAGFWGPSF